MPMSETRGRLDRAIDGAVRRMMAADPPPDLRRRVTDRLAEPARRAWLVPAMAAAAVAVVVIATVLLQPRPPLPVAGPSITRSEPPPGAPASEAQPAAGPQPGPRVAPEQEPRPLRPAPPRASPARRFAPAPQDIFGPRTDRVTAANVPPEDSGLPLDASRGTAPGVPDLEPIYPIAIPPLVIEPIVVSPVIVRVLPPTR